MEPSGLRKSGKALGLLLSAVVLSAALAGCGTDKANDNPPMPSASMKDGGTMSPEASMKDGGMMSPEASMKDDGMMSPEASMKDDGMMSPEASMKDDGMGKK